MYFSEYELMFAVSSNHKTLFGEFSISAHHKFKRLIINVLLRNSDTIDGEDITDLIKFLEMIFPNRKTMMQYLNDCRVCSKNPKIVQVIEQIEQKLSSQPELSIEKENPIKNLSNFEREIISRKYKNFAEFALDKEFSSPYKQGISNRVDTGKFENLDREHLVEFFVAKNFYKLTPSDRIKLFQAVVNEFCENSDYYDEETSFNKYYTVNPSLVEIAKLPIEKGKICFGEYNPNTEKIAINTHLMDLIDDIDPKQSQFLLYKLLETLIHEATHRYQFETLNAPAMQYKDEVVGDAIKNPKCSLTYPEYLVEFDELDARNSALQYIREIAQNTDNQNLKEFYDFEVGEELRNKKSKVKENIMELFPEIYYPQTFNTTCGNNKNQKYMLFQQIQLNCQERMLK